MPNAMILKKAQRCTYTKAPAATMKTEKLDEDKKKTTYVNGGYFEEGDPVSSTNDPAVAYMKTKKPAPWE